VSYLFVTCIDCKFRKNAILGTEQGPERFHLQNSPAQGYILVLSSKACVIENIWHTANCSSTQLLTFIVLVLRKSASILVRLLALAFILKAGKLRHKVICLGQQGTGRAWSPERQPSTQHNRPLRSVWPICCQWKCDWFKCSWIHKSTVWMVCLFLLCYERWFFSV